MHDAVALLKGKSDEPSRMSAEVDAGEAMQAAALIGRVRWIALVGALVAPSLLAILIAVSSPFAKKSLAVIAAAELLVVAGSFDVWRSARLRSRGGLPARAMRRGWAAAFIFTLAICAAVAVALAPWGEVLSLPEENVLAALAFGMLPLAFVTLVFERGLAVDRFTARPEVRVLDGLLRLAVLAPLAMAALVWFARLWPAPTPRMDIAVAVAIVAPATELAVRAAIAWLLPVQRSAAANPVVERLALIALLSGAPILAAGRLLARESGLPLRRTWASSLAARALPVMTFGTVVVGWVSTGIIIVKQDQRAVYERFGAPSAVFAPGLHVGLPWPFGRTKPVDYGVVRQIFASTAVAGENATVLADQTEDAETLQPLSANRLWDATHPFDRSQIVAGTGNDRRGLQAIEADIRLFYRVGMSDRDALRWTYGAIDVESAIVHEAGRLLLRFFSQRTLDQLLSEKRDVVERDLTAALAAQVNEMNCGIEILAVVVEAMHPPPGAANAYHGVQAAAIATQAMVAAQRGRAVELIAEADRAVTAEIEAAHAGAEEDTGAATAGAIRFAAERSASLAVGRAFTFERYLAALAPSLAESRVIVADHRLSPSNQPVLDLRSNAAQSLEATPVLPLPPGVAR